MVLKTKPNYSLGAFRDVLHEAIAAGLREGVDDIQINGATQLGDGWMHINGSSNISFFSSVWSSSMCMLVIDARNIPALGRIGDPDDILGSVLVENGKVAIATSYVPCTTDGLVDNGGYVSVHACVPSLYG